MTKKIIVCILLATVIVGIALVGGCTSLDNDAAYEQLQTAINNTLHDDNAHIFYWKEAYSTPRAGISNLVVATKVNVLCTIDKNYNFVKSGDAEYDYDDLKVHIVKTTDGKTDYEAFCGVAEDGKSYLAEGMGDYTFTEMTAREYVLSDAFKNNYSLEVMLKELKGIKKEDIVYDGVKNGGTQKKGNVVTITCKMTDEYLDRYKQENGKDSVLNGAYITFETAYDRISSIIVYQKEEGGGIFTLEYESYKLEIVYTGPKFTVPAKP